jgi:nonsense-mediated mRNA decay protein 3
MNCVECGADTEPGPLCMKCQLEKRKRPAIPEFIDLTVCGGCGATLTGGTWKESELEDGAANVIAAVLEKKVDLVGVKVELDEETSNIYFAKVVVRSRAGGAVQRDELSCRLRLQIGTCETCGRLSGNYFECNIQIRADGRLPSEEELDETRAYVEKRIDSARSGDRTVFMSKVEEVKGGIDMYLSSNQLGQGIARDLAERRGAQYSAANELFGQKDGREIYRMTFLVRLPSYWPGSFAVLGCAVPGHVGGGEPHEQGFGRDQGTGRKRDGPRGRVAGRNRWRGPAPRPGHEQGRRRREAERLEAPGRDGEVRAVR